MRHDGSGNVVIRQIREADIDDFYQGLTVVVAEQLYLGFSVPPPIESTRAFVVDNISRGIPQRVLVVDGAFAGWCDVTPGGRSTNRHVGHLGMALLSAFRGRGLGERLLRSALDASWAFGFEKVELSVFTSNPQAEALYRKVGFHDEGLRRKSMRFATGDRDERLMAIFKSRTGGSSVLMNSEN